MQHTHVRHRVCNKLEHLLHVFKRKAAVLHQLVHIHARKKRDGFGRKPVQRDALAADLDGILLMPVHLLEVLLFVVVTTEADDAEMRKKRAERKNPRAGQSLRQVVDVLCRADFAIPQLICAARDRPKQPCRAVFQPARKNVCRCAPERHDCRNEDIHSLFVRPV